MNGDFLMNDTFDNFAFTQTEQFISKHDSVNLVFKKNTGLSLSQQWANPSQSSQRPRTLNNNEISFDDSAFLSESSLPHKGTATEYACNEKETKKYYSSQMKIKGPARSIIEKNDKSISTENRSSIHSLSWKSSKNEKPAESNEFSSRENILGRISNISNSNKRSENQTPIEVNRNTNCSKRRSNESPTDTNTDRKKISTWGLPVAVLEKYEACNMISMFSWQVECLSNENVLNCRKNLIYSAPTSAGKTLVAEMLAIKTLFEVKKKVIFILPFVSIVREKMYYLQNILGSSGIRVEGFMGSYNPPGGFASIQVAICTIEKANSLINRLLEEEKLSDIGAVVVDEMHLLGDPSRGYLLELLLTKLKYISKKQEKIKIQIIGMSATLPNLNKLAEWLDAELYTTCFRPVPLHEQAHVCGEIYDTNFKLIRKLSPLPDLGVDTDNILQLCLETIKDSCSVLIFCPTKNWCESLAQQISVAFYKIGNTKTEWGELLRRQLNSTLIMELLEQLKYCPVGLDDILCKTVSFGVAFHHAGLTIDERDIIEGAFRNGALRILVATSTLSSGVNLPARRVIIRTPNFHGKPIDILSYRQMIGRAGRMGKDTLGESILICQKNDYKIAKELMCAKLRPVESCLNGEGKLKRAILEVIASGVASTPDDVDLFTKCTLLAVEDTDSIDLINPIEEAVTFLKDNEFIRLQEEPDKGHVYVATSLGRACLSSSMAPDEGLALFTELEKARQCFVLDTELHLIYLITPYNACHSWGTIDWMFFLNLWEKLPSTMKKVGELVGVRESYIVNATRGKIQTHTNKLYHKFLVHKRFFVALALQDLVDEKPLNWVCNKFSCNRGMLQSLQQSASSFAGMVTSFSRQLGWSNVELLISQFQDRLQFGVSRDLLDLMRLPILNGKIARTIYNAGIETVVQLANSDISTVENILHKSVPFETGRERDGESDFEKKQRNKYRNVWVTGKEGLTEREAAEMFVMDGRSYLKLELGLAEAKWEKNVEVDGSDQLTGEKCEEIEKETETLIVKNTYKFSEQQETTKHELEMQVMSDENITSKEEPEKESLENYISDDSSLFSKDLNISDSSSIMSDEKLTNIEDPEEIPVKQNESREKMNNDQIQNISSNFTSSFSDIDFSCIEQNLKKNISDKAADIDNIPNYNSRRNEVSQFLSPSSVELSISGSLEFSSHSNFNISVHGMASDQSLFDESFHLQLNESDGDSNKDSNTQKILNQEAEKVLILDTPSFLENAFTGSFNITEQNIVNSEILSEPRTIECSRKRTSESVYPDTPTKKIKMKLETEKKSEENFYSVVDFSKMEIVDVCQDVSLLNLFCKEVKQQTHISLSVACRKIEDTKTIGGNIIKLQSSEEAQNSISIDDRKVEGFCFAWEFNIAYYISLDNPEYYQKIMKMMKSIVGNKKIKVKLFDAKEQIKVLKHCCGLDFQAKIDDPKIADWILDPEGKEKNLKAMTVKYCPEGIELSQLSGGCKGVGSIGLDLHSTVNAKTRSAVEAILTWHLVDSLTNILTEENPEYLKVYDVESDVILCLAHMEISGISVSKTSLQELVGTLRDQISAIEKKAFSSAGKHFSFVSSKDVAKVIGVFKGRKMSMKKQVLEKNEHPISDMILQWRKINSTLTKMIYPLIRMTKNDHIHGCYITHTSTGRITMHEPNLQNITKDFIVPNPLTNKNLNISCRNAFQVADNFSLLSADYCQLELRILAHFSQDKLLCNIMNKPGDVFKSIAAKWNHVEEDDVTDALRQNTKNLCYGIIYGMGSKTLADQLNLDENEAIDFMETFRNTYPGIKMFIKDTVEKCRTLGYVETTTGRKRYLPSINDTNIIKRGQAERQAVNTIIQGSAADIAKKAMVAVEKELHEIFCKTKNRPKLVLHLHDELIYEVPTKYIRKVAKSVKKNMENSVVLSVPFPVKLKTGQSWGSMTEFKL